MNFEEAKKRFVDEFFEDGNKYISEPSDIKWAVEKAYHDMTFRTIPGVGKWKSDERKKFCCETVEKLITDYFKPPAPEAEDKFDTKHNGMCQDFLDFFNEKLQKKSIAKQEYGKAQKIINMTFKYLSCFEDAEDRKEYFKFCHMPLDSYILNWYKREVKKEAIPEWSNLKKEEYKEIQKNIRIHIEGEKPLYRDNEKIQKAETVLECEFLVWQEEKWRKVLKDLESSLSVCKKDSDFTRWLLDCKEDTKKLKALFSGFIDILETD